MTKVSNRRRSFKFFKEGIRLDSLKEYQKAIEAYDKAIELLPNDHAAYHNKSLTLASLGRGEEALECMDIAMDLNAERYDEIYQESQKEADEVLMIQDLEEHLAQGRILN